MCGIVGCFHPGEGADALGHQVRTMAAAVTHRGPDSDGEFIDETAGLALGFRRLAVLDLTPTGGQPMVSHSGRYVVVFNGEIYNHTALRRELTGVSWRGTSDTEVIVAALDRWGIENVWGRLRGMFAIALWDREERRLTLVRDRLGEKPLYYGLHGGALLIGSELKALCAHPLFHGEVDRDALSTFLYASFVPTPRSIWKATWKLPAGHSLSISAADVVAGTLSEPVPYWSLHEHITRGAAGSISDVDAVDQLDALLRDSVAGQMEADVPLGAFLSGGIDSSTIVSLMQAVSIR